MTEALRLGAPHPRETDDLYHYTSASVGLDSILAQMQLRVGLLELTNDPRESRARYPSLSLAAGVTVDDSMALMGNADRLLRRAAKVVCFTRDFELPDAVLHRDEMRGWAHPSLWAHYGGSHAGVCLRFSREALAVRIKRYRASPEGRLFAGAVNYDPNSFNNSALVNFSVEQIDEFGLDAVVIDFIDQYHRHFFFQKHPDWASELEYRWVMVDGRLLPIYVDVSGCVTGIVLGDAFPESRLDAVAKIAEEHGLDVSRVFFRDGRVFRGPQLSPEKLRVSHRRTGGLQARVRALKRAERAATVARRNGEALAAPMLVRLGEAIYDLGVLARTTHDLQVETYGGRVTAIPPIERRRAPGAPVQTSKYESGYLCVVSKPLVTPRSLGSLALVAVKIRSSFSFQAANPWRSA
jgi:hypothetical protein